jgi:hypothetical protein
MVSLHPLAALGTVGRSLRLRTGPCRQMVNELFHLLLLLVNVNAYLSMEIEPNSVQLASGVIALKIRNGSKFLNEGLGELFGLVLVARDNVVAFESLVDIELVIEVNGHAEEISHFLSGLVVAVARGIESREARTVLTPFCNISIR